jgi:hypothetical protein
MEEFEAGPGVEFGALVAEEDARYSLPVDVADEKLEPRGIAMVETWSLPAPARRGEDEFQNSSSENGGNGVPQCPARTVIWQF